MQAESTEKVVITRDTKGETVNGKARASRVYVTGPHFGTDTTFSSTEDPTEASVYFRHEAEALLKSGKWLHHTPRIEPKS